MKAWLFLSLCVLFFVPLAAHAQAPLAPPPELLLPPSVSPATPTPREERDDPALALPPLPPEDDALEAGLRVRVDRFEVRGSKEFPPELLEAVTAPFAGRSIGVEELLAARDALTDLYHRNGFFTSGAFVPDQDSDTGVIVLEVVEGELEAIEITGVEAFRAGYFRERLKRAGRTPVNGRRIEAQLNRFQRDDRVERIEARLLPGSRRGAAVLHVRIFEGSQHRLAARFSNETSPRVGSLTGALEAEFSNLAGVGERWGFHYRGTAGVTDLEARLDLPVTAWDTRLLASVRHIESRIEEAPFDSFDIRGTASRVSLGLAHPLWRSAAVEVSTALSLDRTATSTRVEPQDFFCSQADASDCRPVSTVARLRSELVWRGARTAAAARSTLSVGIPWLGATDIGGEADSRFVAWLVQLQGMRELPRRFRRARLLARFEAQIASDELLAVEQASLGGASTIRGYRENQLVRDEAWMASFELEVPLYTDVRGRRLLTLAPFVDFGRSWSHDGGFGAGEDLASLGLGAVWAPWTWLHAEIEWGGRLVSVDNPRETAQDFGLHFLLEVRHR